MPALAHFIYLDRLVALRRHQELARVVVVEAEDVGLGPAVLAVVALELLLTVRRRVAWFLGLLGCVHVGLRACTGRRRGQADLLVVSFSELVRLARH